MPNTSLGLDENLEGALCYLFTFITGVLFLLLEKDSEFVKFHAIQSILFAIAWFILSVIFSIIPVVGAILNGLLYIVGIILWLYLMYKAYSGEYYKLPYIGDIAEEQSLKIKL